MLKFNIDCLKEQIINKTFQVATGRKFEQLLMLKCWWPINSVINEPAKDIIGMQQTKKKLITKEILVWCMERTED